MLGFWWSDEIFITVCDLQEEHTQKPLHAIYKKNFFVKVDQRRACRCWEIFHPFGDLQQRNSAFMAWLKGFFSFYKNGSVCCDNTLSCFVSFRIFLHCLISWMDSFHANRLAGVSCLVLEGRTCRCVTDTAFAAASIMQCSHIFFFPLRLWDVQSCVYIKIRSDSRTLAA